MRTKLEVEVETYPDEPDIQIMRISNKLMYMLKVSSYHKPISIL